MTTKPTNHKFRNTIIVMSLLMFVVPFIFISNLYPFMRFGMFAEKPTTSQGIELFEVRYAKQEQPIGQQELAIPPHMLSYLIRTAYYKNEISTCAKQLHQLAGNSKPIEIYRRVIRDKERLNELIYVFPND